MLGFFRRFINSKGGVVVTFIVLGIIAIAFAAGDVTGLGHNIGGMTANNVAEVGGEPVPEVELVSQTKNALRQLQQEQPTADMAGLIQAGGVERLLEQIIDQRAAAKFAQAQGIVISKRSVDGVIASIPAFRGPDGKFSQMAFEAALSQQRMSERDLRRDIAEQRMIQFLTAPANGASKVPMQMALPYASLLLERRTGAIGMIPAAAVGLGAAPTDAEVAAFYKANIVRYTVPERRTMRYAIVTPDGMKAQATPTEADLQAAYKSDPARFAASEKRTAQVVVVLDKASADALAAKVRGGTALDAAARAVGLEARTLSKLDKAAIAAQTSAAVGDAIFAAQPNAVVGPIRAAGGFTVAKVTAVEKVAARTLDQVRSELIPEVTKANQAALMAKLNDALDTAASEGASFDEIVRDNKLTAEKTPALMRNGVDPQNLKTPADPKLAPIVQAGFAAEQGDAPQIVPIGTDGGFALVALDNVAVAAPRPLAEVRADVAKAFQLKRAQDAARKIAAAVVAKVDAGTPLATALAQTGLKLPPAKPVDVPRAALAANPNGPDPALALMFAMAPKRAKVLAVPQGPGWAVVYLDTIIPGDATKDARTLKAARDDLTRGIGREMIQQFGRAMRDTVGVERNPTAIAKAKAQLSGDAPDTAP
jgi:peptidyl-prolyl cis-trans isomerase D